MADAVSIFGSIAAPPRSDGGVLALGVDDDAAARPEAEVRDNDAGAFTATRAADQADVPVIAVTKSAALPVEALADPGAASK